MNSDSLKIEIFLTWMSKEFPNGCSRELFNELYESIWMSADEFVEKYLQNI